MPRAVRLTLLLLVGALLGGVALLLVTTAAHRLFVPEPMQSWEAREARFLPLLHGLVLGAITSYFCTANRRSVDRTRHTCLWLSGAVALYLAGFYALFLLFIPLSSFAMTDSLAVAENMKGFHIPLFGLPLAWATALIYCSSRSTGTNRDKR